MGIETRYVEGRACPFLICDHCGEPIEDPSLGMARWIQHEDSKVRFFHKAECDRATKDDPDGNWWYELRHFFFDFLGNTKIEPAPFEVPVYNDPNPVKTPAGDLHRQKNRHGR
jgi:hypothetical protein